MLVTCPNCATRLQLEAAKVPARPFTVRCPKCQFIISAQPPTPTATGSALAVVGDLPTSSGPRKPLPAPPYQPADPTDEPEVKASPESSLGESELAQMLLALLRRGLAEAETPESAGVRGGSSSSRWERRSALVCAAPMYREDLARTLAGNSYEVFVAEDAAQAAERLRESRMDVLVLDPKFDPVDQGAARVTREVNSLRPAQRRRLFFVQMHDSARTADTHAAFLKNVNLVLNPTEMSSLPDVLERVMREHNDLYHDFNHALGVSDL